MDADGGWRTADGGWRMRLFFFFNRMFILLNLLVNCHLLRNASFGYFFLKFDLIYILLLVKSENAIECFFLFFSQISLSLQLVELRTLVRHTIRQNNTFAFMNICGII